MVTVAVEGITDVVVVRRLLHDAGLKMGRLHLTSGKGKLDAQLKGYNNAARFAPWLVVRDLDRDARCPPEMVKRILPSPAGQMCLRIAVRAMEAWLLADRDAIARFLGIRAVLVPTEVEALPDPKRVLVELARKSPRKSVREEMVPFPGTTARVGPRYTSRITEYASQLWRPAEAAARSESLRRCMEALQHLSS